MKRRYAILLVIVALLVGFNIWRWWPASPRSMGEAALAAAVGGFRSEDFRLKVPLQPDRDQIKVTRDLFQPRVVAVKAPVEQVAKAEPDTPLPPTAAELAERAARYELSRFKLVGVVFRGRKGQAFLVKENEMYTAVAGDKVGRRFVVDRVTTESVYLKDPATKVSGQIPVSGN